GTWSANASRPRRGPSAHGVVKPGHGEDSPESEDKPLSKRLRGDSWQGCQFPPPGRVDEVSGLSGHGRAAVRPAPHRVVQDMHSFRSLVPAGLAVALAAASAPAGAQDTQ